MRYAQVLTEERIISVDDVGNNTGDETASVGAVDVVLSSFGAAGGGSGFPDPVPLPGPDPFFPGPERSSPTCRFKRCLFCTCLIGSCPTEPPHMMEALSFAPFERALELIILS